ncbi:MAG: hypothetical protein RLY50_1352, partial [Actinomycetota bacterium]
MEANIQSLTVRKGVLPRRADSLGHARNESAVCQVVFAMSIYSTPIARLDGSPDAMSQVAGKVTLVVNVASKCGLTPQYEGLETLQKTYGDRGFSVLGVPCNQFKGQEPGTAAEIAEFCSATYGVTFPLTEKIEVNGEGRH